MYAGEEADKRGAKNNVANTAASATIDNRAVNTAFAIDSGIFLLQVR
jgi:hypothetical protein